MGAPADIKPIVEALKYESDAYLGQAVFATDETIFATGYDKCGDGRLLGIKGCLNHPSSIWEIKSTEKQFEEGCTLMKREVSQRTARSPRLLKENDGSSTLFWLTSGLGGGHAACSGLHSLTLGTSEQKCVLEDVQDRTSPDQFPGLYPEGYNLPSQPFLTLKGTKYITVSSSWGSRNPILLIDTASSAVHNTTPEGDYHWSVLGTDGKNRILAVRSSLVKPPELLVGIVGNERDVSWTAIDTPSLSSSRKSRMHLDVHF
jgi:acylaminoacyl-peptidase